MEKAHTKETPKATKPSFFQKPLSKRTVGIIATIGVGALSVGFSQGWINADIGTKDGIFFWIFSVFFAFFGVLGGVIMGDKNIRTIFLRQTTKQNYGFVHFVSRGGSIFTVVKNLDRDTVTDKKGGLWAIDSKRIYKAKDLKNPQTMEITDENITTAGGIPQLFLSMESMKPLVFHKDQLEDRDGNAISPDRMGSAVKTTVATETAKGLLGNKTATFLGVITIVVIIGVGFLAYQNYQFNNDVVQPFIDSTQPVINSLSAVQNQPAVVDQATAIKSAQGG